MDSTGVPGHRRSIVVHVKNGETHICAGEVPTGSIQTKYKKSVCSKSSLWALDTRPEHSAVSATSKAQGSGTADMYMVQISGVAFRSTRYGACYKVLLHVTYLSTHKICFHN